MWGKVSSLLAILVVLLSFNKVYASSMVFTGPAIEGDSVILESNDAGEVVRVSLAEYEEMLGHSFMLHLSGFFNFKKSFETVSQYLTPFMERTYDVFIFVNVAYETRGSLDDYIPSQHMRVLRKKKSNQKVFKRNSAGVIVDVKAGVLGADASGAFSNLTGLMAISSGAGHFPNDGQPYVDTPTGIYRINDSKAKAKRYGTGMWHSLYFDLVYPSGRVSGLALHGTSSGQYKHLGTQRSHGCVRMKKTYANSLYENIILSENYTSKNLPDLNRYQRLKSEMVTKDGQVVTRKGKKALIILFYGYDSPADVSA